MKAHTTLHQVEGAALLSGRAMPAPLPGSAEERVHLASEPEGLENPGGFPKMPGRALSREEREPGLGADGQQQDGPRARLGSEVRVERASPGPGCERPHPAHFLTSASMPHKLPFSQSPHCGQLQDMATRTMKNQWVTCSHPSFR